MGISRDSRHKRRATGGRMPIHQKKRKFEMGRQPTGTKLGKKKVVYVRGRGGELKYRALTIDEGNFTWQTQSATRKTRIIDTVYHATNNEFSRTKTILKNSIVTIDCAPFKQWYATHYGETLGNVKGDEANKETKISNHVKRNRENNLKDFKLEDSIRSQFKAGRLLACISSRPGQSGRAYGYILEGKELEFYLKKMDKKGKKK